MTKSKKVKETAGDLNRSISVIRTDVSGTAGMVFRTP